MGPFKEDVQKKWVEEMELSLAGEKKRRKADVIQHACKRESRLVGVVEFAFTFMVSHTLIFTHLPHVRIFL